MSMYPDNRESRRVYTGRVINLDIDRILLPNGIQAELEIVRHPGASAIIPVLGNPDAADPVLVLVRQFRYAAGGYLYEIPAGRLNQDETASACALRELMEETGYRAAYVELLFSVFTTPGFTDERIHVFHAYGLTLGSTAREADEVMSIEEIRLSRAVAMVRSGEIQDAKTALSLLFFHRVCAEI
jgi:ADP-ribose diphosphatase